MVNERTWHRLSEFANNERQKSIMPNSYGWPHNSGRHFLCSAEQMFACLLCRRFLGSASVRIIVRIRHHRHPRNKFNNNINNRCLNPLDSKPIRIECLRMFLFLFSICLYMLRRRDCREWLMGDPDSRAWISKQILIYKTSTFNIVADFVYFSVNSEWPKYITQ